MNSAQLDTQPAEGEWPHITVHWTVGTGTELPDGACDILNNSVWYTLDACLGDDPSTWGWELVASGLDTPADGSGQVMYEVEDVIHLSDWNYEFVPFRAVTFRCAGSNMDDSATSLTCPDSDAPQVGICLGIVMHLFFWPPDFDGSGTIDTPDLLEVLENYGAPWDITDVLYILQRWGHGSPWT